MTIGQAVEDMNARIEQIVAASGQITASANSMEHSVAHVVIVAEQSSVAAQEVLASTRQTSASTEHSAASADELASNAEAFNELVHQFKPASRPDRHGLDAPLARAGGEKRLDHPDEIQPKDRRMSEDTHTRQLVAFRLGPEPSAFAIGHVQEIIRYTEPRYGR